MSTERKPGSRGVRDPFAGGPGKAKAPAGGEPGARENTSSKGSTKTSSPRDGFKKKRRK